MKNTILIGTLIMFSLSKAFCFMPKNNMYISKYDLDTNGMTKEKFEAIFNRAYQTYSPIVKAQGATLIMENHWDDGTVNASASRQGSKWYVEMYGGLARHPLVTDDGFLLVVCHEIGHHVGGFPTQGPFHILSNEGQADYFGTLKCMKRVLEKDDNLAIMEKRIIDPIAKTKCEVIYKSQNDIALCERTAMAAKSLGDVLALDEKIKVAFDTPDKSVVKKTFGDHAHAQCRMDTYLSGALCDKPFNQDVSKNNPIDGTCIKKDGYVVGPRPLCWYKPSSSEI